MRFVSLGCQLRYLPFGMLVARGIWWRGMILPKVVPRGDSGPGSVLVVHDDQTTLVGERATEEQHTIDNAPD